jgi:hypothetical protein
LRAACEGRLFCLGVGRRGFGVKKGLDILYLGWWVAIKFDFWPGWEVGIYLDCVIYNSVFSSVCRVYLDCVIYNNIFEFVVFQISSQFSVHGERLPHECQVKRKLLTSSAANPALKAGLHAEIH